MASVLMLLATTSCGGSDEPKEQIWYAVIPLMNHVTDSENERLVSCKETNVYSEINVDRKLATFTGLVALHDSGDEVTIDLANIPVKRTTTPNGFLLTLAEGETGGHEISDFEFFVDMRQDGVPCHYLHMIIDGRFEVNGLLSEMSFEISQSDVTSVTGQKQTVNTGKYVFSITEYSKEKKLAAFSVKGLNVFPLDNGIEYQGLTLEPTYAGYHITAPADGVEPKEGGGSKLEQLEADIDVHSRTFTASFAVHNSGSVTASGSMP